VKPAADGGPAAPDTTAGSVANDPTVPTEAAPQREPAANESPDERPGADARRARIHARAYRRAESRGFASGHELDDWLAAEAEEPGDETRGTPR
jgi:hypothetical protein